jgi:hypothetical protein
MGRVFVRAFPGTYVVQFQDIDDWGALLTEMSEKLKSNQQPRLRFLMSPLIDQGARYNGGLSRDVWSKINGVSS